MPTSASTISTWLLDSFHQNKTHIRSLLYSNAISSIHLSFDLWTSSNYLALLAVIAFWVDESGCIQHALLGLPRLLGSHTGENQGQLLWQLILDYGLQDYLGYFCLDNASNNLTALHFLSGGYSALVPDSIQFNTAQRYIRCYASNQNEHHTIEKENRDSEVWRKIGPLGKLRNIIVWIRNSPQRRE
ncbi:unnamed protein product, partial [Tuber aestivum]